MERIVVRCGRISERPCRLRRAVDEVGRPCDGVTWSADDDTHLTARYAHEDIELALHLALDADAHIRSATFERWGDPDNAGDWGSHPFGLDVTGYATFDGVTIPSAGRVGWFHGTERWVDGEFFRYEITELRLVAQGSSPAP